MGGFSFTVGSGKDSHEIAYFNLGVRNAWGKALIDAEIRIQDIRCPFDEDGACHERGCLNPDGFRGYVVNIHEFLAVNKRVLSFLDSHTETLSHKRTWTVADCEQFGDFLEEAYREPALSVTMSLIISLEAAIADGARHVFIWDCLSDSDLFPCPRSWYTVRAPRDGEFLDREVKPSRVIEETIMSYDEALEKQRNGEWKAMVDDWANG